MKFDSVFIKSVALGLRIDMAIAGDTEPIIVGSERFSIRGVVGIEQVKNG